MRLGLLPQSFLNNTTSITSLMTTFHTDKEMSLISTNPSKRWENSSRPKELRGSAAQILSRDATDFVSGSCVVQRTSGHQLRINDAKNSRIRKSRFWGKALYEERIGFARQDVRS